jgi:hypothetical protein
VSQPEGVLITGVYGSAEQISTAEGAGLKDLTIVSDRPVDVVAQEIMTFLGWP